jgi:hypothetical protein
MKKIIDQRIGKRTRRKTYCEYLVKWKGHPEEYASWVSDANILKKGKKLQDLMDMSAWPEKYDVGSCASTLKRRMVGGKNIIQRMHKDDLDSLKGEIIFLNFV